MNNNQQNTANTPESIEDSQEVKEVKTEQIVDTEEYMEEAEDRGEAIIEAAMNTKRVNYVDEQQNAKITELTADLQRTRADFENFRRQNDNQREQYANSVKLATIKKFLPLIDDFERAIAAQPKELAPLAKNLEKTLKNLGLTKIDSTVGVEFNLDIHNAISVEGDGENETIAETLQTGYYYEGEVLREALVRVSKS